MIGTITLNPCIDKTLVIQNFRYGGMNRVLSKREDVSGKGINVAVTLTNLGVPVRTLGIRHSEGDPYLQDNLLKLGITYESVLAQGYLRENIKVLDTAGGITTELNQKGAPLSPDKLQEFDLLLDRVLPDLSILVITGSVPPGVDMGYYAQIIARANRMGVKTILDAEGELLRRGMEAGPTVVKPNLYEMETAFGVSLRGLDDAAEICQNIIGSGVSIVCLSAGKEGALITNGTESYVCRPTPMEVKSTQGAGDSMVAGLCMAMEQQRPLEDLLRYGVAAAQGSLLLEGTQLCRKEDFERFKEIINIEKRR